MGGTRDGGTLIDREQLIYHRCMFGKRREVLERYWQEAKSKKVLTDEEKDDQSMLEATKVPDKAICAKLFKVYCDTNRSITSWMCP